MGGHYLSVIPSTRTALPFSPAEPLSESTPPMTVDSAEHVEREWTSLLPKISV